MVFSLWEPRSNLVPPQHNFPYETTTRGNFTYIELDLKGEARKKGNLEIILSALDEFEKQNNREIVNFWIDKQQTGEYTIDRVFGVLIKSKLK